MCVAKPMKIIEIKGKTAIVETDSHKHKVNLALLKNIKIGDYILTHGNIAINKIPQEEAENIFKIINFSARKNASG